MGQIPTFPKLRDGFLHNEPLDACAEIFFFLFIYLFVFVYCGNRTQGTPMKNKRM